MQTDRKIELCIAAVVQRSIAEGIISNTRLRHLWWGSILTIAGILLVSSLGTGQTVSPSFPEIMSSQETYTDDLPELIKKRTIRVLITFNKTNFFLSNAKHFYGFEYSLLKEYEKFLNTQTNSKRNRRIMLQYIPVRRDQLISGLLAGAGDIAAAQLTITPTRLQHVDFTESYRTVDEVIVTHKDGPELETFEDLAGREVFVRESSSYYQSLIRLNGKVFSDGRAPIRIVKADEGLETEDILYLVNYGAVEITVADDIIAEIWSEVFEHVRILDHIKIRTGGELAWMVRKNTPELKQSLNAFIREHRQGTLLGNIYFKRYFKENEWITEPPREKDLKRYSEYVRLFERYAKQYGFQWHIIMAVAYEESRLDQSKKGPDGGVGMMQIRPSTAADKHIKIPNIALLENNIHAGVKYLAHLKNHYFGDALLAEQEQLHFVLAAYNAGPIKIAKARKRAEAMGLDPDRWFGNVEQAALKYIGQIPVRYVSNIHKNVILFTRYAENEKKRNMIKRQGLGNN